VGRPMIGLDSQHRSLFLESASPTASVTCLSVGFLITVCTSHLYLSRRLSPPSSGLGCNLGNLDLPQGPLLTAPLLASVPHLLVSTPSVPVHTLLAYTIAFSTCLSLDLTYRTCPPARLPHLTKPRYLTYQHALVLFRDAARVPGSVMGGKRCEPCHALSPRGLACSLITCPLPWTLLQFSRQSTEQPECLHLPTSHYAFHEAPP
jgi:hypothetical protein